VGIARRITCPIFIMNGPGQGPVDHMIIKDVNHLANNRPAAGAYSGADWMTELLRPVAWRISTPICSRRHSP
jgi:hypothetical protein